MEVISQENIEFIKSAIRIMDVGSIPLFLLMAILWETNSIANVIIKVIFYCLVIGSILRFFV